jgi:hypothetical protein
MEEMQEDNDLSRMLMGWYYAGYNTGYYMAKYNSS